MFSGTRSKETSKRGTWSKEEKDGIYFVFANTTCHKKPNCAKHCKSKLIAFATCNLQFASCKLPRQLVDAGTQAGHYYYERVARRSRSLQQILFGASWLVVIIMDQNILNNISNIITRGGIIISQCEWEWEFCDSRLSEGNQGALMRASAPDSNRANSPC